MLGLLLRLGFWQLDRAAYKDALDASFQRAEDAAPVPPRSLLGAGTAEDQWRYRKVSLEGVAGAGRQYLLDNRTHRGRAGYHVLTVVMEGGRGVIVNRGWAPANPDRSKLPALPVESAAARYSGRLVPPPRPGLLLGDAGYGGDRWPRVVQRVELDTMSKELGVELMPAVVLLDPAHPACLVCQWKPGGGVSADRHRGYALQWFSLAVALVVLVGVVTARWVRRRD